MRKILLLAIFLSLAVYFLTQESITVGHSDFLYHVPLLYPALAFSWLFCGGIALGLQWSSWEKYRMRSHIRYYQSCAEETEKKLDEARWIVCEMVRGKPLLRLSEIAEDYRAMMSIQGENLALMRNNAQEIDFSSNRVIEQALKDEKRIQEALHAEDSITALHQLQSLPWDCWSNADTIDYILKQWSQWSDPVRIFFITKIAPMYWKPSHQEALLKTILEDKNHARWTELLKKYKWFEPNAANAKILQAVTGLLENENIED